MAGTFEENARELARYEIGTIIRYGAHPYMVVGIFNVPDGASSLPYLAIIPKKGGLNRYLELMRQYTVHDATRPHGSHDYVNFIQRPRDWRAALTARDFFVIPMSDFFGDFAPVGDPMDVYVGGLQPMAKKFPIGSEPVIKDYSGYVADGIFLGLNKKGAPTLFMTLFNRSHDKGPSKFQTRDYVDVMKDYIEDMGNGAGRPDTRKIRTSADRAPG